MEPPTPPSPSRGRSRPALLCAGVLVLATPFLFASPAPLSLHSGWPWAWDERAAGPSGLADLALWLVAGALALLAGLGRLRLGALGLGAAGGLAAVVAARAHGLGGALPVDRAPGLGLGWTLALATIGAGALVVRAPGASPAARRGAGGALLLGAAAVAFLLFAWSADGRSGAGLALSRLGQVRTGLLRGGEHDDATLAAMARDACWHLLPTILVATAALVAAAAGVRALRAPGRPARGAGTALLVLLAASALAALPGALGLYGPTVREALLAGPGGTLAGGLVGQGLAVGALLAAWLAEALRAAGDAPRPPPLAPPAAALATETPPRAGLLERALARGGPAVALAALLALALSAYRPDGGVARAAWPWEAATSSPWGPDALPALLAMVAFAALLVAVLRPGLAAAAVAAAAVALSADVLLHDAEAEALFESYGVTPWVPVALAALAAAAATRPPAAGRVALAVAGLALAALLVFPLRGASEPGMPPVPGWRSGALGVLFHAWFAERAPDAGPPALPWAVAVLGHVLVAACALALAALPRGRRLALRGALLVAWAATLLVPPLVALVAAAPPTEPGSPAPPPAVVRAAMRLGPLLVGAAVVAAFTRARRRPGADVRGIDGEATVDISISRAPGA